MNALPSKELESKQLDKVIMEVYNDLNEYDGILSAPDNDFGIFKYTGTSPQSQFHLSKMSKKRNVQRTGLGFVIQKAELPESFRISMDLEITDEVTGKDSKTLVEVMNSYAQNEYNMQSPTFIIYKQPAHSGKRGWENKIFVGIELEVSDSDFDSLIKLKKKIINNVKKMFQAVDYALSEY